MSYVFSNSDFNKINNDDILLYVNNEQVYSGGHTINDGDYVVFTSPVPFTNIFFSYQDPYYGDLGDYYPDYSNGNKTAVFDSFNAGGLSVYQFDYELEEVEPFLTIDQTTIDLLQQENVSMTVNGNPVYFGMVLITGDEVVTTAPDGYKFYITTNFNSSINWNYQDSRTGDVTYLDFELNGDGNIGSLTIPENPESSVIYFFELSLEQSAPSVTGTNRVYEVNNNIIESVNSVRFANNGFGGVTDYGQFILSLLKLPFNIPDDIRLNSENIILGNLDTNVSATRLGSDYISLSLGSIHVSSNHNNLLDYKNKAAILHLPLANSINIDIQYVINHTITITYDIDVYSGIATVNISSTAVDEVLISNQVDIGVKIPYINTNRSVLENTNISVGGNNEIITPFIEIVEYEALMLEDQFNAPMKDYGDLMNGYVVVDNIELKGRIKLSDRQKIINLLSNGVIIK